MERFRKRSILASKASDHRETFFFFLFAIFVYAKFYFLEQAVSPHATRHFISALSSAGIVLCLTVLLSLLWRRIRGTAALAVDFLLSALIVTDLLHLRYFSDMFTFINIGLSVQVKEISDSVVALICARDLLYFSDIPFLIFFICISKKLTDAPFFKRLTLRRLILSLLLLFMGAAAVNYRFNTYQKKVPGVLKSMWDRPAVCNNVGALTYHLADLRNAAGHFFLKEKISEDHVGEIKEYFEKKAARRSMNSASGTAKGKNLIIIQVESLQQFVPGLRINGSEVTPNLNKFIKESVYFSAVYSQTGSGNSSDAELVSNTALHPSSSGAAFTRFAGNRYEALPNLLAKEGYTSLALHGDRPGFWNRNRMYPSMGFSRFVSKKDFEVDESIGLGLSDASFFRQSLDILDKTKKPYYAFLITLTSHYPYNFEGIFKGAELDTSPLEGTLIGNYLTAMKYFDVQLGKFLEGLKKKDLYESSVIVLYGDHPAIPYGRRTDLGKLIGRELDAYWQWKDIQKVPLVIRIPGGKIKPGERKDPAGLISLPETISNLFGSEFKTGFGVDLFGVNDREPVVFRNGSFVVDRVFVEPSLQRATGLDGGEAMDYEGYVLLADEVKKRLTFNDMILDHDLIPKVVGIKKK